MGAVKQAMLAQLPSDAEVAQAMMPTDIRDRIARLAEYAQSDPEKFHVLRDEMYRDVLCAVAAGPSYCEPRELAAAALEAERVTAEWEACA